MMARSFIDGCRRWAGTPSSRPSAIAPAWSWWSLVPPRAKEPPAYPLNDARSDKLGTSPWKSVQRHLCLVPASGFWETTSPRRSCPGSWRPASPSRCPWGGPAPSPRRRSRWFQGGGRGTLERDLEPGRALERLPSLSLTAKPASTIVFSTAGASNRSARLEGERGRESAVSPPSRRVLPIGRATSRAARRSASARGPA